MNQAPDRQDFAKQVIIQLMRSGVDVTPVSFELMHEALSGDSPDLRQQMQALGGHLTNEDIDRLGRQFLPHHFGHGGLDGSAVQISEQLSGLETVLAHGQESLSSYATALSQASEQFARVDPRDTGAIRRAIDHVSHATAVQKAATGRLIRSVSERIENVRTIRRAIDQSERARFIDGPSGLGNRRAFNRRMGDIFNGDHGIDGYTLILCRVTGLDQFDRPELAKARAFFLARLGGFVRKLLKGREGGFWLGHPHMAIIVFGCDETYVTGVARRIHVAIEEIAAAVRHSIATAPLLVSHFGCASTDTAGAPPELLAHAQTALETSSLNTDGAPVFYAARSLPSAGVKNYALYGRNGRF